MPHPPARLGSLSAMGLPLPPAWWRGPGTHGRLRNNKRRSRVPGAGASGRGALASTTDDSLSGLASDPLRPEGRTIPPLPAVPSVRIVRRDDRTLRKGWDEYEGDGGDGDKLFAARLVHDRGVLRGSLRSHLRMRMFRAPPLDGEESSGITPPHPPRHSRESGNPVCSACASLHQPVAYCSQLTEYWIPAFAGMTSWTKARP